MKIIKASVEFMELVNGSEILRHLERCGRVCYKSEGKIEDGSAEKFIRNVIKRGHESVLEHKSITVKFICDRGVSHEIVRHRIASFSQESTRYCDYGGEGIVVIEPCYLDEGSDDYEHWEFSCMVMDAEYETMRRNGCSPQEARAVLPNSLKTEVVMTANIREWRHFLRLRCSKAAHPQMREVAIPLLQLFYDEMPVLFEDVYAEVHGND